jgi:hypothetical protein
LCDSIFNKLIHSRRSFQVHLKQLNEILRDADVANAIFPVVRGHRMSEAQTERALTDLHVPRAANVAGITHHAFPRQLLLCNYQGEIWSAVARLNA